MRLHGLKVHYVAVNTLFLNTDCTGPIKPQEGPTTCVCVCVCVCIIHLFIHCHVQNATILCRSHELL
jgi:hypothetical protein